MALSPALAYFLSFYPLDPAIYAIFIFELEPATAFLLEVLSD
jgi:hypothetical protein